MNETEKNFWEFYSSSILLFNIRFSFYVSKISSLLNTVQYQLLEPINLKLIDDDIIKRERIMAGEFERRFSRINLYSIQLKLRKLEKDIMMFKSKHGCKISQSFVLRAVVLSIFKYLANSLQIYSKFIRKSKIGICMKLKDLLNYISHTYQTVEYIVDHRVLKIHDLAKLSCVVLATIHGQNFSSAEVERVILPKKTAPLRKSQISKIDGSTMKCSLNEEKINENSASNDVVLPKESTLQVDSKQKKNLRFEICEAKTKTVNEKCEMDKNRNRRMNGRFKERLCAAIARLCETVLHDIINEITEDILESIGHLAVDTFNRELNVHDI